MKPTMTRRQLLSYFSAAGIGSAFATRTVADYMDERAKGPTSENKIIPVTEQAHYPARIVDGKVIQPERPLPVFQETDVLVVGGGAAGFAAATAAARAGAKTILVERYGYMGGLWTGGMVLVVMATHVKENDQCSQVVAGIGGELMQRLSKLDGGIVNLAPNKPNPTSDPEATKFMMDEMVREAGVKMLFHCWATDVVMDGTTIRGVIFESKSGRQAILAKVIIDTTGDGDIFAAAGAEHEQRLHAIGLVHRLGNIDRVDRTKLKANMGSVTPLPSVTWINLRGPATNALDINELSRLEMEHRRSIWNHAQKIRQSPGGEQVYLLNVAPQLGVRITRLLAATKQLTYAEARKGEKFPDTIAVGGAEAGNHIGWPIPYGALIPKKLDNLITAGRSICVDTKLIEEMRLIGPCLVTGHAAGAAAAVAVQDKCTPRAVDIAKVQKLLKDQGAFLG